MTALHILVISISEQENKTDDEKNSQFDEFFKYFKKKHIKLNLQDEKGYTSLHYAIIKKNNHIAHELIRSNGININVI